MLWRLAVFLNLSIFPVSSVTMEDKELYIAALEKKLFELSGIEVDQIKKNQLANASSEARAIREMAEYVDGILVKQAGQALVGKVSPQVAAVFEHIKAELGKAAIQDLIHVL